MKQVLTLFFLCTACFSLASVADEPLTNRILVTFVDSGIARSAPTGPAGPVYRRGESAYLASVGVANAARRIAKEFQLEKLDEWPIAPLNIHCIVYRVAATTDIESLLAALKQRADVEAAQRLETFEVFAVGHADGADPYAQLQHVLATLEIPQAHAWSLGRGVSVTIIDTGADLKHPELLHQIDTHKDFVTEPSGNFSSDAHGTAIAGIISASADNGEGIIGIAPQARLSVFKACWYGADQGRARCDSFTLAKALSAAIESDTDIINLSLGGPPDGLLERLVGEALRLNIKVVAAAPKNVAAGFPANVEGVFVVDELNVDLASADIRPTELNAPGTDILVAVPEGGYDYSSGSSLAAAHVSGVIALLVAIEPELGAEEINTLLMSSRQSASGPINACRALAHLLETTGCNAAVQIRPHDRSLQRDRNRQHQL